MLSKQKWEVGTEVIVAASDINHDDKRRIHLKYKGNGILQDIDSGKEVSFNDFLFPNVFEGMCLSLGLTHNIAVCESYEVLEIIRRGKYE